MVAAREARPAAGSATPIHSRRLTRKPNKRAAGTGSSTSPPPITDWTSEIGASASAVTWNPHDPVAITIPSTYHFDPNRASDERTGRRHSIGGDSTAPLCL